MSIAAKLYRDQRSGERYAVDLPATLRAHGDRPVDVAIDELSQSGFRLLSPTPLPATCDISIGIAGVGMRTVHVIRQSDGGYGCAFAAPLTQPELAAAMAAPQIVVPSPWQARWNEVSLPVDPRDPPAPHLSPRTQAMWILGLSAATWAAIVGVAVWLA